MSPKYEKYESLEYCRKNAEKELTLLEKVINKMTVEKYRPKNWQDALTRISEECSEVIKLVCKAQRFGLHDIHPKKDKENLHLIAEEMEDVKTAYGDFLRLYNKSTENK